MNLSHYCFYECFPANICQLTWKKKCTRKCSTSILDWDSVGYGTVWGVTVLFMTDFFGGQSVILYFDKCVQFRIQNTLIACLCWSGWEEITVFLLGLLFLKSTGSQYFFLTIVVTWILYFNVIGLPIQNTSAWLTLLYYFEY